MTYTQKCPVCGGKGFVLYPDSECSGCDGAGWITIREQEDIDFTYWPEKLKYGDLTISPDGR